MKIRLNGEDREFYGVQTLADLLDRLGINARAVIIEQNKHVIPREQVFSQTVCEGDQIEIMQFVGGGSHQGAPSTGVRKKNVKKTKPASFKSHKLKGPKNLVVVESPAKAKTINKFLGNDYQVEASMGHVRDLPKSKMGVDIENGFRPHYIVLKKAQKIVRHLKRQAAQKEQIFLAPDPDREGEAISWHLSHIFREVNGNAAVIHRVVFNEITREAVQDAFRHPRHIQMNLVNAQQARRILDRIVGYELSPLLWRKVGRGLSAGRVQSVALRLIVEREREIRQFVPEEYWTLEAKLKPEKAGEGGTPFIARLDKIDNERAELKNHEQTEKIRQEILGLPFRVASVDKRERKRKPHAPYTTSKLQQEAYNRLGFPAAKTMRIAQRLYEGVELGSEGSVGLITYMRTDSVNISKSAQQEAIQFIRTKFGPSFLPKEPPVYKSKKGAQEAHEAIRPTSIHREPVQVKHYLSNDEFKLYELIWQKFTASQMTPALDHHVSVLIRAGERYIFKATGRINLFPGFTVVFQEDRSAKGKKETEGDSQAETEMTELPELTEGEMLSLLELMGYQHFTKPPARYNDASLVKTLEEKGIGRPSTYAPTIYTLLSREYVNRKGGALIPTELGETVVDLLVQYFPKVMDVQFTATMEEELDKIEEGEMEWHKVLEDFYQPFRDLLAKARKEMKNIRQQEVPTEYTCDVCGRNMVIKWGRFGKFLACPGFPECRYTRSLPTGFRCPVDGCGGELVKRSTKNRRTFYGCSNYPKCTYIVNRLPKKEEDISEDDKLSDLERETLGP